MDISNDPAIKTVQGECGLKALTIIQPYASLIMNGKKRYEMRNWIPRAANEFVVHAGRQTLPIAAMFNIGMDTKYWDGVYFPLGALLGVVCVTAVLPTKQIPLDTWDCALHPIEFKYAWRLEVVEVFKQPIPMRGKLGFWTVAESVLQQGL